MDPGNSRAWYSLAVVQHQQGEFEHAITAIQVAHKIDPDDLNLFAVLRLESPVESHRDPKHALELATRATANEDEFCLTTLQMAKEAAAG